jgi:hypothetical protein
MPSAALRTRALPVALATCVLLAAGSLLLPHTLAYDPWAWMVWGREVVHGSLDTATGPSWKPLPVMLDSVFSLAGGAAPDLWLATARASTLAAMVFAYRVGTRAAGAPAGVLGAGWIVLAGGNDFGAGLPRFFALGWSEGPLAALALAAVDSHLRGRPRAALLCALGAALIRVEAWPYIALYAVWLWRAEPQHRRLVAGSLLAVPLLWFGPELWGSGRVFRAGERARLDGPALIRSAAHPGLRVLAVARDLLPLPVEIGALLATGLAVRRAQRGALVLAAATLGWLAIVAGLTEAGYAGSPRYLVLFVVGCCVLAGWGWVLVAKAAGRGHRSRRALVLLVIAVQVPFAAGRIGDVRAQWREGSAEATSINRLGRAVQVAGGAAAMRACGVTATNRFAIPALIWRLGLGADVTSHPARADTVIRGRVSPGGRLEPAPPPGFQPLPRTPGWQVLSRCPAVTPRVGSAG